MDLNVGQLPDELYELLDIPARTGYRPVLLEAVRPVVIVGDAQDSRTIQNIGAPGFIGFGTRAAVAGQFSMVQLYCAADTPWIVVDRITYRASAAMPVVLLYDGNPLAGGADVVNGQILKNLDDPTSASLAATRTGAAAALPGTGKIVSAQFDAGLNTLNTLAFERPLLIKGASGGLIVAGQTVNVTLSVTFEWREVPEVTLRQLGQIA